MPRKRRWQKDGGKNIKTGNLWGKAGSGRGMDGSGIIVPTSFSYSSANHSLAKSSLK
jgi:hypothetical protein